MNPQDFGMLMFGLLSVAMDRDKQAHSTSISELAALCPDAKEALHGLHAEYCKMLDNQLEEARKLIEHPFVDEEGGTDDPGWRHLTYLTRNEPPGDQGMEVGISYMIRTTFGQPLPKRPYPKED